MMQVSVTRVRMLIEVRDVDSNAYTGCVTGARATAEIRGRPLCHGMQPARSLGVGVGGGSVVGRDVEEGSAVVQSEVEA